MSSHFVYTVSEFRKKQRSAFEFAQAGATVVIDRYGEKFVLKHYPGEDPTIPDFDEKPTAPPTTLNNKYPGGLVTVPTEKNNSVADATPFIAVGNGEKPSPEVTEILKQTGAKFCKAGHLLAPNSGRCLQKGCKYA